MSVFYLEKLKNCRFDERIYFLRNCLIYKFLEYFHNDEKLDVIFYDLSSTDLKKVFKTFLFLLCIHEKTTNLFIFEIFSSASNRIIAAKDHASIQINIADVDETTGRMTSTYKTYAICGQIRRMGESDDCINRLAKKDGVISKNF